MASIGLFLDRDGTINREVDFLRSPEELELIPGSAEAIYEANRSGWRVVVITNQSGIARGLLTEHDLDSVHDALRQRLAEKNASLDRIYYCPHHPDFGEPPYRTSCDCRKPATGMLARAANELDIDLSRSFVIGDRMIDVQTGNNGGVTSILVLTGYGKDELELCRRQRARIDFIADDLRDAMGFVKCAVQQDRHAGCYY